jgi:putative alpha-1,2-mannosidase
MMQPFAEDYKNGWDFNSSYFCPKFKNGSFWCQFPFDPYPFDNYYQEGNSAEYRWYVPHDLRGLVGLFPSADFFSQQLNEFFELAYLWPLNTTLPNWSFWAGNEPDILTQVQFNYAGNQYAHLTQYWFPTLLDTWYYPYASGVPGNDDYGTMSAWVVWGYVGMYPVSSTDEYALFAPRFDSIDFNVAQDEFQFSPWRSTVSQATSGSTVIVQIRCYNRPASGTAYVANISVNGVPLPAPIVKHQQLLATSGGKPTLLEFYLSGEPSVFGQELPSRGGPAPFIPAPVLLTPEMKRVLESVTENDPTPAAMQELKRRHRTMRNRHSDK